MFDSVNKSLFYAGSWMLSNPDTGVLWASETEALTWLTARIQSDTATPELPPELPVFPVTNVVVAAETLRAMEGVWWVEVGKQITITADVALPNTEMVLMIEKLVSGNQPIDDIRRTVTIHNGQLQLQFTPKVSGNYLLSAARLNAGLAQKGKEFRLSFDNVEFEVCDPA